MAKAVLLFIGIAKPETIGYWKFRRERWTLEDFVTRLPRDNVQCKFIAGAVYEEPCTAEICERAKENLIRYFSVVGLLERFEESLALMKLRFGWMLKNYSSFNVTRTRPNKRDLPKSTLDLIAGKNSFDIALYQLASEIFCEALEQSAAAVERIVQSLETARIHDPLSAKIFSLRAAARKAVNRAYSAI